MPFAEVKAPQKINTNKFALIGAKMEQKELRLNNNAPLSEIVEPLLCWYRANARDLPWRKNRDPYRIWISEIMLQQTRVETVKPYYDRFLKELPNISALAQADEEHLFKLWEGLGYYSRARNLKKAAEIICLRFGGSFPTSFEDVLSLPGIGAYTAGAICSIAFEMPTPAVDGNVMRVMARLCRQTQSVTSAAFKTQVSQALRAVYPLKDCGDFTQSLMELGALVCLPNTSPLCCSCPLNKLCGAHADGKENRFPAPEAKKERKKEVYTVFLLHHNDKLALQKRPSGGILSSMWQLPNVHGALTEKQAAVWLKEQGIQPDTITKIAHRKHVFTHIEWDMHAFEVVCKSCGENFVWASEKQLLDDYPLPTAFRKFIK